MKVDSVDKISAPFNYKNECSLSRAADALKKVGG